MTLARLRNELVKRAKSCQRRAATSKLLARERALGRGAAYQNAADLLDRWMAQHKASDAAREVAGR